MQEQPSLCNPLSFRNTLKADEASRFVGLVLLSEVCVDVFGIIELKDINSDSRINRLVKYIKCGDNLRLLFLIVFFILLIRLSVFNLYASS